MSYRLNGERRIAFVLASTDTGTMIVNRLDYNPQINAYSPGSILLEFGSYERQEADLVGGLLEALRQTRGHGVVLIDGGANCGAFTVDWAARMREWGTVIAVEPQRHVYYALAGNIAINNLFNVIAVHGALSDKNEKMDIIVPNYTEPFASGSVTLLDPLAMSVFAKIDDISSSEKVKTFTIDSMGLGRVDYIKLDVEGMEPMALAGAKETILRSKPVFTCEHLICGQERIKEALPGYTFVDAGINTICIPEGDPILDIVTFRKIEGAERPTSPSNNYVELYGEGELIK